jgi:hypothetical protein
MRSTMILVLLAATGCEEKKEAAAVATPPPAAAPAPTPPPTAAAPAAGAPGASGAAAADPGKALAAALGAAAEAPKGDTPCEQAYNGITAMVAAMQKNMPPGGKTTGDMPTKEKFMAGCGALPKDLQQCMVMSWAMAHQKECADAQAKMDPATAAKVKELMGKK